MEYEELDASKYLCFYSSLTENRRSQKIPRGKYGQQNVSKLQMSVSLKVYVCACTHAYMYVHSYYLGV